MARVRSLLSHLSRRCRHRAARPYAFIEVVRNDEDGANRVQAIVEQLAHSSLEGRPVPVKPCPPSELLASGSFGYAVTIG